MRQLKNFLNNEQFKKNLVNILSISGEKMNRFACIFFGTIFIFQAAAAWSADQGAGEKKRDRIVFGCTPDLPVDTLKQIHAPLMEYLGNELGMKAVFIVPKAYEELPRMMREKMVDVGIFAPNLYIQSKWAMPGMKYLVTVKKKNASLHNKSYIVSLKKSSIRSIEDLRGRRFGFSNSQSASGFVYPTAMLKAKKIDPNKYFSKTFFLKKHQKVILALVSGSIDAGATSEAALKSAHWGYGDIFHEIAESQ